MRSSGPNITNSRRKSNPAVPSANGGVVDVLIEIGQQRARILEATKEALMRGDDAEALEYARELTGLPTKRFVVTSPSTQAGS
jgi:hypothetical protein